MTDLNELIQEYQDLLDRVWRASARFTIRYKRYPNVILIDYQTYHRLLKIYHSAVHISLNEQEHTVMGLRMFCVNYKTDYMACALMELDQ